MQGPKLGGLPATSCGDKLRDHGDDPAQRQRAKMNGIRS